MLIDAASLLYRAYHAIPELLAPDGTKVHAALGFLNFLSRLIPDRRPDRLIVALDNDWRPAFRVEALPSYKTHRLAGPDDEPDEVGLQFPILLEIFDAIGLSRAERHEQTFKQRGRRISCTTNGAEGGRLVGGARKKLCDLKRR